MSCDFVKSLIWSPALLLAVTGACWVSHCVLESSAFVWLFSNFFKGLLTTYRYNRWSVSYISRFVVSTMTPAYFMLAIEDIQILRVAAGSFWTIMEII